MISVVLPCYRAASTARASVDILRALLPNLDDSWEIVIVDDGGRDFRPHEFSGDPQVRLIPFVRNRGKGAALRAGLAEARGDVRIFTDIDLPYGCELFRTMTRLIRHGGYHVVLGDRTLIGSQLPDIRPPLVRRVLSAVASQFIGRVVTGGFHDTQCGLKAIRGDIADALIPLTCIDRFAFDVEFVYLCLYHRLDVKRLPVALRSADDSTVRPLQDSLIAALDIIGIKLRQLRHHYESVALHTLVERDMANLLRVSGAAQGEAIQAAPAPYVSAIHRPRS